MAGEFDIAEDILSGTQAEASPVPAPLPDVATAILGENARAGFRPTGSISTITGKPIEELDPTSPDPPDFSTVYKASLVKDYEAKKKIYAEARGVSVDRYGIKDGEVVWLDESGVLRSEESRLPHEAIKRLVASGTSPEVVGGVVGSVGGPAGAAAGAMGGETVRQAIAGLALGDPQTAWTNIFRLGGEGLLSFVGELAGRGVINTANRLLGIGKPGARAIKKALGDEVVDFPAMEAVQKTAKHFDIDLNVAQSTKSRNLAAKIEFLRSLPQSEEVVKAVDTLQNEQLEKAIPKFLRETFGDGGGSLEVGRDLSKAAETAVGDLKKRRGAMTKPLYERAFAGAPSGPKFAKKPGRVYGYWADVYGDMSKTFNMETGEGLRYTVSMDDGPEAFISDVFAPENLRGKGNLPTIMSNAEKVAADNGKTILMVEPVDSQIFKAYERLGYKLDDEMTEDFGVEVMTKVVSPTPKTSPSQVDIEPVINLIDSHLANAKGDIRRALESLKKDFLVPDIPKREKAKGASKILNQFGDPAILATPPGPPSPYDTSLLGLHGMKLAIDKKLDRATASGLDRTIQRELKQVQAVLLKQMDEASPKYKLARRVHALLSKGKTVTLGRQIEASEGLAKLLAETSEKDLVNTSTLLLAGNKTRPEIVRELRSHIVKQPDGQRVWDASTANYIEHVFDNIPDSKSRNIGEALADGILGRRKQKEILKSATTPEQFQAITDFMTVLKRTGITAPKSDVGVARGLTRKQLRREFESEVLTVLTTPLRTPKRLVADRVNEIRFGRGSKQLAETLLSDTAAAQLRSLKRLKPGSRRLIEGVGVFLGLTLGNEAEQRVTKLMIGNQIPEQ